MTRLPDNTQLDGVSREEAQAIWDSLSPQQRQALLTGERQRRAPPPAKRKPSLRDVAEPLAKYYGKQYLNSGAGASVGQAAGGASSAGLAGAGAAGEAGASAGSVAAGQAAGGGTPYFDVGAPSYAGYAAAAMDAYKGYQNMKDPNISAMDKATRQQQLAAMAVADVYTGGLVGTAEGYARGQWGGTMKKLDKLDQRYNPGTRILAKLFGGMSKGEAERRQVRDMFKNANFMDENGLFNFSHGGTYNTEAGTKDEWKIDSAAGENARALSQVNPLAAFMSGKTEGDIATQTSGYLANATSRSGGDMRTNARELYERAGYNKDSALANVDAMVADGAINEDVATAYRNGIIDVFGGGAPSTGNSGQGSGDDKSKGQGDAGKRKKKGVLLADLFPDTVRAPDYGVDLSPMVKNPYL